MRQVLSRAIINCTIFVTLVGYAKAGEAATDMPQPVKLATLFTKNEVPAWGDLIRVERPFGSWNLKCELRPSQNKRLCSTEQLVFNGKDPAFLWRIAMNEAYKPVAVFAMPPQMRQEDGLLLTFAGLQKQIAGDDFKCNQISCLGSFLLEPAILNAMLGAEKIEFLYNRRDGERTKTMRLEGDVKGMSLALEAAATDPFGKQETVSATTEKTPKKPKKN